jgi:outer membrane cobalamin receptor
MKFLLSLIFLQTLCVAALAGVEGSISGTVTGQNSAPVANAQVQVPGSSATTAADGSYRLFPVTFGDYTLTVKAADFPDYESQVHVASGANSRVDPQLSHELVVKVKGKRRLLHAAAVSSVEVSHEDIERLPQGNEISLPKLLTSTTPGTVQGPFGQVFFRGNHANIQYQIDGVQLPDSPSNTFGQAFTPRNIDHMEVITGGIPAEYGERLASVVNIVTKSGAEKAGGEATFGYGTYKTLAPQITYGGSSKDGKIHYFLSGAYNSTDRGLDTPQPVSLNDQKHGGTDAVHDKANGDNEFAKVDYLASDTDKLSAILFNARSFYQVPTFPKVFVATDSIFQPGNADPFGNNTDPASGPSLNFVPFDTDDWQRERNFYAQVVWKHTFSERSFFQLAPYYKYSSIFVHNDLFSDLATSSSGALANVISNAGPSSFAEDKRANNYGLKGDYTLRLDDRNLAKAGFQVQSSRSEGSILVQTDLASAASIDKAPTKGAFESVYVQDDFTILKSLTLNAGLRFDATQFTFADQSPSDSSLQPRIGLSYLATETTKLHAFYGKLFQPAPVENLRDTFVNTGAGQLKPYDIKAEKDDYYEVGLAQQLGNDHLLTLNGYYKDATNMLDDAQLLKTSIAQPYNFERGFAKGIEASWKGQLGDAFSGFANYTYEIAKGRGVSGGIFAFPAGTVSTGDFQFLDHVQLQTANGGIGYHHGPVSASIEGLWGSGLRTGPNNSGHLPPHFSTDLTAGYEFHGGDWWSHWKLSADLLNAFDNAYPITVANGFNGSHYAAGRQYFMRLTKDL